MTPNELETEAANLEATAHVQFALALTNFQRQMGGVDALRRAARQEREKAVASPEPPPGA